MKKTSPLPLLTAASIGALSAALTSAIVVSNLNLERTDSTVQASLRLPETEDSGLREELRALRESHEQLSSRLGRLELQPAANRREAPGASITLTEFSDLKQQVEALRNGAAESTGEPLALKSQVADALTAVRQEEAHRMELRRLAIQDAQMDQRIAKMTDWLGLTAHQATEMRAVLAQKDERDTELQRLWKETGDRSVAGQMKSDNHELHQEELQQVLNSQQFETYTAPRASKE